MPTLGINVYAYCWAVVLVEGILLSVVDSCHESKALDFHEWHVAFLII